MNKQINVEQNFLWIAILVRVFFEDGGSRVEDRGFGVSMVSWGDSVDGRHGGGLAAQFSTGRDPEGKLLGPWMDPRRDHQETKDLLDVVLDDLVPKIDKEVREFGRIDAVQVFLDGVEVSRLRPSRKGGSYKGFTGTWTGLMWARSLYRLTARLPLRSYLGVMERRLAKKEPTPKEGDEFAELNAAWSNSRMG